MNSVKLFIASVLVTSNGFAFELLDALSFIPKGEGGKIKEDVVYQGVKTLLRNILPVENEQEQENEEGNANADQEDTATSNNNKKGNKYTNVNFVLYNSGIRFQKQDDMVNTKKNVKMRFNCILVVASTNKCYGWDAGPTNEPPEPGEPDSFNRLRTVDSDALTEGLVIDGNSSSTTLPQQANESPHLKTGSWESRSRYYRRFFLQNNEDDKDAPSSITIYI